MTLQSTLSIGAKEYSPLTKAPQGQAAVVFTERALLWLPRTTILSLAVAFSLSNHIPLAPGCTCSSVRRIKYAKPGDLHLSGNTAMLQLDTLTLAAPESEARPGNSLPSLWYSRSRPLRSNLTSWIVLGNRTHHLAICISIYIHTMHYNAVIWTNQNEEAFIASA